MMTKRISALGHVRIGTIADVTCSRNSVPAGSATSATEIRAVVREASESLAWLYHGVVNRVAPPASLAGLPGPADIRSLVGRDLGQLCFLTRLLPPRDKAAAARFRDNQLRPALAKTMDLALRYL